MHSEFLTFIDIHKELFSKKIFFTLKMLHQSIFCLHFDAWNVIHVKSVWSTIWSVQTQHHLMTKF